MFTAVRKVRASAGWGLLALTTMMPPWVEAEVTVGVEAWTASTGYPSPEEKLAEESGPPLPSRQNTRSSSNREKEVRRGASALI